MRRVDAPAPRKRKRGGDEKERAAIKRFRKAIRIRERENARAALRLSNVLGWLNLWQDNAAHGYDPGGGTGPHPRLSPGQAQRPPPNRLSPNL